MKTDMELKRDVEEELAWEPSVDASHIAVAVNRGIVTLVGHVPAYGEKCVAERAAARVLGVQAVADELEVKLHGRDEKNDEDVAAACVNALKTNYGVPREVDESVCQQWPRHPGGRGRLEVSERRSHMPWCVI